MSIIQDPETYEKFERVVLAHGVRTSEELAYAQFISEQLPNHPYLGEEISAKLLYYPTVTREVFRNMGRLTDLLSSGKLTADLSLPPLDPKLDRAMICGSAAMLRDLSALLDERGFEISKGMGEPGDYVIERAFAEK
jgi:ferredoxin--NADP+ reductase